MQLWKPTPMDSTVDGPSAAAQIAGLVFIQGCGGSVCRSKSGHWISPDSPEYCVGMPTVPSKVLYALKRTGHLMIEWSGNDARAYLTATGVEAATLAAGRPVAGQLEVSGPAAHRLRPHARERWP